MKEELRKKLKEIRKNQSKKEVFEKSKEIEKKLFSLNEFKEADTVLFYISYDNEVYTHNMIKKCLSDRKNVVVPISDKEKRDLILSKLKSWENLAFGAYDILEPKSDKIEQISVDEIDLAIIPGVGFDENGNRLGHGFAYYDNLLEKLENCFKIGLAFEFQIVNKIPVEEHDIPVNAIISQDRTIRC